MVSQIGRTAFKGNEAKWKMRHPSDIAQPKFDPRRRPDDFVESLRRTTSNILNCSIRDVDVEVKKHYFAVSWRKSVKFAKYRSCLLHYRIRHVKEVTVTAVERCQRHLAKECRTSDVRVIKAIRFFVDEVIPVVDHDPDTKLVYYVRDPRGILLSRWSLSKLPLAAIPFSKIDQMAAYLCAKMRRDLKTALQYREDHPDQLLIMQYETLASSPVSTLQELYRFVGVGVPSDLIDWIQYATQAAKSDGMVGSIRKNGSEVSTRWQHELSPEHLRIIERHCDDVIDLIYSIPFGYR
ncbi:hypothetical protein LSH36_107g08021 [Paralvinella palmiformis]|uniref:Sulfotransferase domain-containing protein n=1 Tax=Paralvinella palmiformis TaxID=53620 RepID=A0AAD9JZ64_9ANNE|nr:hypothetical protein LSH36_107g08021 [Paralvinella palmiformis]